MKTVGKIKFAVVFILVMTIIFSIPMAALAVEPGTLPQEVRFTISVYASPNTGGTVSGGGYYYTGQRVLLQAYPYYGYKFVGWYDENYERMSPEATFEMYAYRDTVLQARFERDYAVTPPAPVPPPTPTPPPTQAPIDPGPRPPADQIAVMIGGKYVVYDVPPMVEDGRTLVPLRATFEALGAYVDWDAATQTVTGRRGTTTVTLTIGQNFATVNGERVDLDAPGRTVAGRTLVPLRFISESLGGVVDWNPQTLTVTITQQAVPH